MTPLYPRRSKRVPFVPPSLRRTNLVHPKGFAYMSFEYDNIRAGDDSAIVDVMYMRTGHELPSKMLVVAVQDGSGVEIHYTEASPLPPESESRLISSDEPALMNAIFARRLWDTLLLDGWNAVTEMEPIVPT